MAALYTNNASTILASGITNSATSLTVQTGNGAKFPNPTSPDYFMCTLQGVSGTPIEIIKVTARSTDTFTIVRAQEGTTASAFNANDIVELRITAGEMGNLPQLNVANTFTQNQTIYSGALTLGSTPIGAGNASTMKNRIINGAMVIDQRNAGASVTQTTSVIYSVDRWAIYGTQASKFTVQQNAGSVTPPIGFVNYLGATSSSAYSVGASETFIIRQNIEGFNISDLGWGTASAKTVTISFQVYSSLTGTFGGSLENSAENRSYPFTYTVSSANTWTTASVTVAGDTTGTWLTTNGVGIRLNFSLGTGSTNSGTAGSWAGATYYSATGATSVVGTNGATFYITGVQLEVGSSATGFEYRQYGTELNLCQRYFEILYGASNGYFLQSYFLSSSNYDAQWFYATPKRAAPTVGLTSGGSWYNATPTIYPGISQSFFQSTSALFIGTSTANTSGLSASSEL